MWWQRLTLALAAAVVGAGCARFTKPEPAPPAAKAPEPPAPPKRIVRPPFPPLPTFAALDADRDGTLSAAEIAAAPTALKALDTNRDGKLTRDELLPRPSRGPSRFGSWPPFPSRRGRR